MRMEKKGLKSGGGGGGFFQLFDWTAKSRKKLFSSKSDSPEYSKQGKRSDGSLPVTRIHLMDEDEFRAGSSRRDGSDYSCASSVTDDDGYGNRAPGVVARLMGLDSLPTSSSSEPNATPFFDTRSLQDSYNRRKNVGYYPDNDKILYSGNLINKDSGPSRQFMELESSKVLHRPIERFQKEVLPPKLARSISITQHKLLSPIKTPGFVHTKSAAHIMEAAARIIEFNPQASVKSRFPVVGSSSMPLKVQDLKEKLEVSNKTPLVSSLNPKKVQQLKEKVDVGRKTTRLAESNHRKVEESNAVKSLHGQSLNKSWNGSFDTAPLRVSLEKGQGTSFAAKNKGKSVSLAVQAKANVQRREGLNSSYSGNLVGQNELNERTSCQIFKSQPNNSQKNSLQRKSLTHGSSSALRPNNQKQNRVTDKDKAPFKPKTSNLNGRKLKPGNSSSAVDNASGKPVVGLKAGSRKLGPEVTESRNEDSECGTPRKKRAIATNLHTEKSHAFDHMLVDKDDRKEADGNSAAEKHFHFADEGKIKGMDVVSFTFTTPLTRSVQDCGKRLLFNTDGMKLPSTECNVIGGNALSLLLEQKLQELNDKLETSHLNSLACRKEHLFQDIESMVERHGNKNNQFNPINLLDRRGPSPVSVLESSFSTESTSSMDSIDNRSSFTEVSGSQQSSSVQARETFGSSSTKKSAYMDTDIDLSDSASSTSTSTIVTKQRSETNWEADYIKSIFYNLEFMFHDFVLGRSSHVINIYLFDQLETRNYNFETKVERKLIFDCVSECVDLRCQKWTKGMTVIRRKEQLFKEVHEEIAAWRGMKHCMVDELVDYDMHNKLKSWLDFEVDAFTIGVEVEGEIFNSLVDEVALDMLLRC